MKIQSINNNQNVSHKAYFKPNAEFKRLYTKSHEVIKNKVQRIKDLPHQEIELLGEFKDSKTGREMYYVFNNMTKKMLQVDVKENRHPLNEIFGAIFSNKEDFFSINNELKQDFGELTNFGHY
jgi:hypothetical protein